MNAKKTVIKMLSNEKNSTKKIFGPKEAHETFGANRVFLCINTGFSSDLCFCPFPLCVDGVSCPVVPKTKLPLCLTNFFSIFFTGGMLLASETKAKSC